MTDSGKCRLCDGSDLHTMLETYSEQMKWRPVWYGKCVLLVTGASTGILRSGRL